MIVEVVDCITGKIDGVGPVGICCGGADVLDRPGEVEGAAHTAGGGCGARGDGEVGSVGIGGLEREGKGNLIIVFIALADVANVVGKKEQVIITWSYIVWWLDNG